MLRVITVGTLIALSPIAAALLWLACAMIARQAAPIVAVMLPPARSDGASAGAGILSFKDFLIGVYSCLDIVCVSGLDFCRDDRTVFGVGIWIRFNGVLA